MTLLWISLSWVFAAAGVAILPLHRQYVPAVILLLAAPVLIVMIGWQVHWIAAAFALAAFVSMFRFPLKYLTGKFKGQGHGVRQ